MKTGLIGILLLFLSGLMALSSLDRQSSVQLAPVVSAPRPALVFPIADAEIRVTKKPFGIKVSPHDSPVQPEHFSGYHTGVDFETFPNERDQDVAISAICSGKILLKRTAQGYGGVLVESCQIADQPVTVVYGHIRLASVSQQVGDVLQTGQQFAVLGKGYSTETDGERKHLHLGIKKESAVDLRGYVQQQSELEGWMDFQSIQKK